MLSFCSRHMYHRSGRKGHLIIATFKRIPAHEHQLPDEYSNSQRATDHTLVASFLFRLIVFQCIPILSALCTSPLPLRSWLLECFLITKRLIMLRADNLFHLAFVEHDGVFFARSINQVDPSLHAFALHLPNCTLEEVGLVSAVAFVGGREYLFCH